MSDSTEGGESGGVASAGQDAEADNEPPQQAPPLLEGDSSEVGDTSEELAPPSTKRPRMSEDNQELEQAAQSFKTRGETSAHTGFLQEDNVPPVQSRVSAAACIKQRKRNSIKLSRG